MEAVMEVLLDESVLFTEEGSGSLCISPALAVLLRRLRYSNLRVGICCQDDNATPQKETLIKGLAATHSLNCVSFSGKHEDSFNKFSQAWNGTGPVSWYITSKEYELFFSQLKSKGWRIVYVGAETDIRAKDGFSNISKLEELPITICSFNKTATCDKLTLMIGYVMKLSREEDFAKAGIFPMYPTQNGLLFVPLTFELPLAQQLKRLDALLHKATDEIIQIDASSNFSKGTVFSPAFCELKRNIEDMPDFCVLDPLNNIYSLLDRHMIQNIICKLDGFTINGQFKIRHLGS
ncbi:hypothetical protein HPP92_025060 [Vanilla planifolia]|uniref:Uncharacterized protein n=1 Tax=Vanilla planifolia TaxID=51239 RepID=A0A835PH61_VANPL|nr:hypothetical protein HPP92_025060 [Vanilla planifolia]